MIRLHPAPRTLLRNRAAARASRWLLLLAAAWALATGTTEARAAEPDWWNPEWAGRIGWTVDTTPSGVAITDPIGERAILVRLHEGNFPFEALREDGADLRFVADDQKTVLAHQIERFDPLMAEGFVWVRLPEIKPGTKTRFWLYYGNPKSIAPEPGAKVFGEGAQLVYHFAERGTAASDATGGGNQAANPGTPAEGAIIGTGLRLDGRSPITIPGTPGLGWRAGSAWSWSLWVKPAAADQTGVIYSRPSASGDLAIGLAGGAPYVELGGQRSPAGSPLSPGTWNHLAAVAGEGKIALWLNGEPYAELAGTLPESSEPALLGGAATAAGGAGTPAGFVGEIDELRIGSRAPTPASIRFDAVSQGGTGSDRILVSGEAEAPAHWLDWLTKGHFGIIISNLTLDGWIVIVILLIMAVISWYIMASKATYLNRVAKGNAVFLQAWRRLADDLTAIDNPGPDPAKPLGGHVDPKKDRALQDSAIYRIYHIGAEEIRHRLSADKAGPDKILRARSIQAIRASLDTGLVRETQKLNRLMVLLTIAISGGPFLGLLGTVVGVMITFAAVAEAGDVNVNAIAPGIAAALLATVAGLAVAIPALFGYNYLISKVKEATSDMHVFIDEFVGRLAEFYGGKLEEANAGNPTR